MNFLQKMILEILHQDKSHCEANKFSKLSQSDWESLISLVIQYRLSYQLKIYLESKRVIASLVPDGCRIALELAVLNQHVHNLSQHRNLSRILSVCEENGIPVILLKGLWIVEFVFRDTRARLSGDIDILIQSSNVPKFTTAAHAMNIVVPQKTVDFRNIASGVNEYTSSFCGRDEIIDVHWGLTHPFKEHPIDEISVWERSEEINIRDAKCLTLKLEDHLIYLCFHVSIHHRFLYVGPRSLIDISELIQKPPREIEWSEVVARAKEFRWDRGVWLVMNLIQTYLGVSPPEHVMEALRPTDIPSRQFQEKVMEAIFLFQGHTDAISIASAEFTRASWSNKIRIFCSRVFIPHREIAGQFRKELDSRWFYFLYVRRMWRLLTYHFPMILKASRAGHMKSHEVDIRLMIEEWLGN